MRGVNEQLLAGWISNPAKTVTEFVPDATTNKKTREDLQKCLRSQRQVALIAEIIKKNISGHRKNPKFPHCRHPIRKRCPMPPQPGAMFPLCARARGQFRRQPPPSASEPVSPRNATRKTDISRGLDHCPLCYHCRKAGHVYRLCSYQDIGLLGFAINTLRLQLGEQPIAIADYNAANQCRPRRPSHSPSPGHYLSLQCRPYTGLTRGRSLCMCSTCAFPVAHQASHRRDQCSIRVRVRVLSVFAYTP